MKADLGLIRVWQRTVRKPTSSIQKLLQLMNFCKQWLWLNAFTWNVDTALELSSVHFGHQLTQEGRKPRDCIDTPEMHTSVLCSTAIVLYWCPCRSYSTPRKKERSTWGYFATNWLWQWRLTWPAIHTVTIETYLQLWMVQFCCAGFSVTEVV